MSLLEERIQQVFQEVLEDPNLTMCDEMTSKNLQGWDSFAHVKLVIALEEEFDVEFSMNEVANIASVAEFKNALRNKGVVFE